MTSTMKPAPLALEGAVSAQIDVFASAFSLSRESVVALGVRCLEAELRADPEVVRARVASLRESEAPKPRAKAKPAAAPARKRKAG